MFSNPSAILHPRPSSPGNGRNEISLLVLEALGCVSRNGLSSSEGFEDGGESRDRVSNARFQSRNDCSRPLIDATGSSYEECEYVLLRDIVQLTLAYCTDENVVAATAARSRSEARVR